MANDMRRNTTKLVYPSSVQIRDIGSNALYLQESMEEVLSPMISNQLAVGYCRIVTLRGGVRDGWSAFLLAKRMQGIFLSPRDGKTVMICCYWAVRGSEVRRPQPCALFNYDAAHVRCTAGLRMVLILLSISSETPDI